MQSNMSNMTQLGIKHRRAQSGITSSYVNIYLFKTLSLCHALYLRIYCSNSLQQYFMSLIQPTSEVKQIGEKRPRGKYMCLNGLLAQYPHGSSIALGSILIPCWVQFMFCTMPEKLDSSIPPPIKYVSRLLLFTTICNGVTCVLSCLSVVDFSKFHLHGLSLIHR